MVALPQHRQALPTSLEVFALLCWARAHLYSYGMLSLHDAVDFLQDMAEQTGLVAHIGQDAVQAIMATEFGAGQC